MVITPKITDEYSNDDMTDAYTQGYEDGKGNLLVAEARVKELEEENEKLRADKKFLHEQLQQAMNRACILKEVNNELNNLDRLNTDSHDIDR